MVAGRAQAEENLCAAWATKTHPKGAGRVCPKAQTHLHQRERERKKGGRETNAACICESN